MNLGGLLAIIGLLLCGTASAQLDSIRLQLKWKHQFQFAGYYAAKELGYYEDAGLAVQIREVDSSKTAIQSVLTGQAEYGVSGSEILLQRANGKPLVVLGVIFQHSPMAIVARQDSGISALADLANRKVMVESDSGEILAYLLREHFSPSLIKKQIHSFGTDDFISGKVDAMTAYLTDEIFVLKRLGIPYLIFSPRSAGVDFYGDNLFTTETELQTNPARVKAFRNASLRGWEYAMNHPEQVISWILKKYSTRHDSLQLAYEAASMQSLVGRPIIPIGYMHRGRWEHIAETYVETGVLQGRISLDGFLYEEESTTEPSLLSKAPSPFYILVALLALVTAIVLLKNRRLHKQILVRIANEKTIESARLDAESSKEELIHTLRELEMWATTDKLTELANRRHLEQRGETEVARAIRYQTPLSFLLIDLDYFKQINDREGHHMGDAVLVEVAKVIRNSVRLTDLPGRWGGEEFLVLVPNTASEQASVLAEKLRKAIAEHHFPCHQKVTASFGITSHHACETLEDALRRADTALYQAKQNGRNRVVSLIA